MKYILFAFTLTASASQVSISMQGDGTTVPGGTVVVAQFTNHGNDTVHVVINGVDKGDLFYPYKTTYTSNTSGANTITVTTCSYMGVTAVTTFTTVSGRVFSRQLAR